MSTDRMIRRLRAMGPHVPLVKKDDVVEVEAATSTDILIDSPFNFNLNQPMPTVDFDAVRQFIEQLLSERKELEEAREMFASERSQSIHLKAALLQAIECGQLRLQTPPWENGADVDTTICTDVAEPLIIIKEYPELLVELTTIAWENV